MYLCTMSGYAGKHKHLKILNFFSDCVEAHMASCGPQTQTTFKRASVSSTCACARVPVQAGEGEDSHPRNTATRSHPSQGVSCTYRGAASSPARHTRWRDPGCSGWVRSVWGHTQLLRGLRLHLLRALWTLPSFRIRGVAAFRQTGLWLGGSRSL